MKTRHLILAIIVSCFWGFNFSIIKMGVAAMDPSILTGLRFTFAAFPAVLFIRRPQVSWKILMLYGLTFGVGVWGMLTLSIYFGLSAGMSSLIIQASIFITLLFGVLILKEKLSLINLVGLIVAVTGLALIMNLEDGSVTQLGIIFALLAAISLSCVNLMIKKANIPDMFAFIVWSSLSAPIPLFLLSWLLHGNQGFNSLLDNISYSGVISVFIQAYPVTLLGYWTWNKIVATYPLTITAPLKLLVPLFAIVGSVIFYDEPIGPLKLTACLLIMLGLVISISATKITLLIAKLK